ncbi:YqhA family protein [Rhizobium mongolense]|nr:YqhA family protein [Rhizobium mongolense]
MLLSDLDDTALIIRVTQCRMCIEQAPSLSVIAAVLRSTDKFIFGIILIIFAYAITFGFVFDVSDDERQKVPRWMLLSTINELKILFFQVIILYLVVHFATLITETEGKLEWNTLVLRGAILLLAAAMKLVASSSHDENRRRVARK